MIRVFVLALFCVLLALPAAAQAVDDSTPPTVAIPLDKPAMDTASVLAWTARAASEAMTFDFGDYQKKLQRASKRFTKVGWETFAAALQRSRLIDVVTKQQQAVSAQPKVSPVLVEEGVVDGKYRWVVSVPIIVTYKNAQMMRQDTLQLRLVIERVKTLESPDGIGIAEWKAE
jgi:intracellular multiplication protein IcmL